MTKLTRERVIKEIDELVERISNTDHRLRIMEEDRKYHHLSFVEVRGALDESEKDLRFGKRTVCSNELDFREVETLLTEERRSLTEICETLSRVQAETAEHDVGCGDDDAQD